MNYLPSVKPLAHYIVNRCYQKDHPITNLQLQKILYFLQFMYCRKLDGKALLFPEAFHAWSYGPVISDVFEEFSEWGSRSIVKSFDDKLDCTCGVSKFLDDSIDALQRASLLDLACISYASGSPWAQVYKDGSGYKHEISNDLIIEFARTGFKKELSETPIVEK